MTSGVVGGVDVRDVAEDVPRGPGDGTAVEEVAPRTTPSSITPGSASSSSPHSQPLSGGAEGRGQDVDGEDGRDTNRRDDPRCVTRQVGDESTGPSTSSIPL